MQCIAVLEEQRSLDPLLMSVQSLSQLLPEAAGGHQELTGLSVLGVRSESGQEAAGGRRARPECTDGAIPGPPTPAPSTASSSCLSHLFHPLSLSLTPSCNNLLRPCSKLEELFFHSALLTLDLFSDWQPRCFPGTLGKERSFLHFN